METVRSIQPKKIISIQDISRPFSNFDYCEKTFQDLYPLKVLPIRRLFSQLRFYKAKTLITEELHLSDDIREEDKEIKLKKPKTFQKSKIFRLSFFNTIIKPPKPNLKLVTNRNFLGYAIIKQNIFQLGNTYNIFESVIKQSPYPNNYIHAGNIFEVNVAGKKFHIRGSLYCQQNRITNECAHSALRTLLSSLKRNQSISASQINRILGIDHKKHKLHPFTYSDILKVLKAFKLKYYPYDKKDKLGPSFEKYLYASVESGNVALLGFSIESIKEGDCKHHIVPVVGHTFNQDTWVSNAEQFYFQYKKLKYLPSDSWTSTFIMHDDNFGSHYCLPPKYLDKTKLQLCLATIKENCASNPLKIEPIAVEMLKNIMSKIHKYHFNWDNKKWRWLNRLFLHTRGNKVIFRTLLIKKGKYISRLKSCKGWNYDKMSSYFITYCQKELPPLFWMVEISIPELFSINRRKLGELILDCNTKIIPGIQPDWGLLWLARLPGCFFIRNKGGTEFYKLSMHDHMPLYPLPK